MKIKPYIEKLNNSKQFADFKTKNPNAYFSAGFFVLDFEKKSNMHQIDYYIPETKKMQTFVLDGEEVTSKESEGTNKSIPKAIDSEIILDLDILKGIVEDEMKNHTVTKKILKIIAIIQNIDGKLVWNLNCITSDMGIMKVHVEDASHSILKFDNVNIFNAVKKL